MSRTLPLWILFCALAGAANAAEPAERNLLTMGAGAVIVRATPRSEIAGYVAIDGSLDTRSIGTAKREPLPLAFVIELPAATSFSRFVLPTFNEFGSAKGRHIRSLRIEGSSSSADDGFMPLVEATLETSKKLAQHFPVALSIPVRWVRVTLLDRHEPPKADFDNHNFTELEGYGKQEALATKADGFNGRWRFRRKGLNDEPGRNIVELFQNGAEVKGCQRVGGEQSTISGTIIDGLARLVSEDTQGRRSPFTAIVLADGQLSGVSFDGPPRAFYAAPSKDAEAPCSAPPVANPIADALSEGHTATLYGIHFDVDSDVLRPDAEPALEQLLEALQSVPKLAALIEGHTDSDGSDAHNVDLSERRAKSVIAWLVARGVDATRIAPVGKGEGEPIAGNDTSAGRALNRRVEVEPRK